MSQSIEFPHTYEGIQQRIKESHRPQNEAILAERMAKMDAFKGSRTGDWLVFPDGRTARIAHHWGDCVQPSSDNGDTGSFYLSHGGYADYSGALDPAIPLDRLTLTTEKRKGRVWFFDLDHARAHNGVDFYPEFRVFQVAD